MDPTVERARLGEAQAMSEVLVGVRPALQRFALRLCRDVQDAEDVSQDALIAIAKNLARYEGRGSLSTWAFTLARTACVRKRRGAKNRPAENAEPIDETPASAPHPELIAELRELATHLERALALLPEEHRAALVLRDLEGVDTATAARTLGITPEALKSRLFRGRRALRELLADFVP